LFGKSLYLLLPVLRVFWRAFGAHRRLSDKSLPRGPAGNGIIWCATEAVGELRRGAVSETIAPIPTSCVSQPDLTRKSKIR
jgi:hypothetical protein